jgi:putative chitobiose transport system permease protein
MDMYESAKMRLDHFRFSRRRLGDTLTAYAFLAIPLLVLIVFFVYPLFFTFRLSFMKGPLNALEPAGFANYLRLPQDAFFTASFKNSLLYVLLQVPGLVVIPFLLAIVINQTMRGMQFFRILLYMPYITSLVIVGIAWRMIYNEKGVLSWVLTSLGIIEEPIAWLARPDLALPALVAVTIWQASGWYMVVYWAGLKTVPQELKDAALIDGANRFQVYRYVVIPYLNPYITLVAAVAVIGAMRVFTEVLVMTNGGPGRSTTVLNFFIYVTGFRDFRFGYAASASVVFLIVTLILATFTVRVMEREVQ